jgi:hypothetical protein
MFLILILGCDRRFGKSVDLLAPFPRSKGRKSEFAGPARTPQFCIKSVSNEVGENRKVAGMRPEKGEKKT